MSLWNTSSREACPLKFLKLLFFLLNWLYKKFFVQYLKIPDTGNGAVITDPQIKDDLNKSGQCPWIWKGCPFQIHWSAGRNSSREKFFPKNEMNYLASLFKSPRIIDSVLQWIVFLQDDQRRQHLQKWAYILQPQWSNTVVQFEFSE